MSYRPTIAESKLTFTDITTNDASTSNHGFVPKLPNDVTKFFNGTGAFSLPGGGGPGTDLCLLYDSAGQAGTSNTDTVITFASELYDPGNLHNTGSNTSRITIATTGTYLIFTLMALTFQVTNTPSVVLKFFKNGSAIANADCYIANNANTNIYIQVPHFIISDLTAADYIEACVTPGTVTGTTKHSSGKSWFGCLKLK